MFGANLFNIIVDINIKIEGKPPKESIKLLKTFKTLDNPSVIETKKSVGIKYPERPFVCLWVRSEFLAIIFENNETIR